MPGAVPRHGADGRRAALGAAAARADGGGRGGGSRRRCARCAAGHPRRRPRAPRPQAVERVPHASRTATARLRPGPCAEAKQQRDTSHAGARGAPRQRRVADRLPADHRHAGLHGTGAVSERRRGRTDRPFRRRRAAVRGARRPPRLHGAKAPRHLQRDPQYTSASPRRRAAGALRPAAPACAREGPRRSLRLGSGDGGGTPHGRLPAAAATARAATRVGRRRGGRVPRRKADGAGVARRAAGSGPRGDRRRRVRDRGARHRQDGARRRDAAARARLRFRRHRRRRALPRTPGPG